MNNFDNYNDKIKEEIVCKIKKSNTDETGKSEKQKILDAIWEAIEHGDDYIDLARFGVDLANKAKDKKEGEEEENK